MRGPSLNTQLEQSGRLDGDLALHPGKPGGGEVEGANLGWLA